MPEHYTKKPKLESNKSYNVLFSGTGNAITQALFSVFHWDIVVIQ